MKVTISYSPDEGQLVNKVTSFIMKQYPEYGARVKTDKGTNQHGRYHRYITSRPPEEMGQARAKGLAHAVKAVNRRLEKLEKRLEAGAPVDIKPRDIERLKAHFANM